MSNLERTAKLIDKNKYPNSEFEINYIMYICKKNQ